MSFYFTVVSPPIICCLALFGKVSGDSNDEDFCFVEDEEDPDLSFILPVVLVAISFILFAVFVIRYKKPENWKKITKMSWLDDEIKQLATLDPEERKIELSTRDIKLEEAAKNAFPISDPPLTLSVKRQPKIIIPISPTNIKPRKDEERHLSEFCFSIVDNPDYSAANHYEYYDKYLEPLRCPYEKRYDPPKGYVLRAEGFFCRASTRVKIAGDPNFFFNANFVGEKGDIILCQDPTERDIVNFLKMITEYNVRTIVMLTDPSEVDFRYFPDDWEPVTGQMQEMRFKNDGADFIVQGERRANYGQIERTKLTIMKMGDSSPATIVRHYYFPNWYDLENLVGVDKQKLPGYYGDPIESSSWVVSDIERRGRPILIHCREGTGPSGALATSLLLMDAAMSGQKHIDPVYIARTVRGPRDGAIGSPLSFAWSIALAYRSLAHRSATYVTPCTISLWLKRYQNQIMELEEQAKQVVLEEEKKEGANRKSLSRSTKSSKREIQEKKDRARRRLWQRKKAKKNEIKTKKEPIANKSSILELVK